MCTRIFFTEQLKKLTVRLLMFGFINAADTVVDKFL